MSHDHVLTDHVPAGVSLDGDAITASTVGGPFYGTLSFGADGTFVYTPFKDFNGRNFAYAFRPESREYRNTVEEAIECLKLDGTLRKLHEKWYGSETDPASTLNAVFFGYGAPGFKGFEPTAHVPRCN